jgi:hypothetical protein
VHEPSAWQVATVFGLAAQMLQLAPHPHPPPQGVKPALHA